MMKTQYLSAAEREKGMRHYLHFAMFNGSGFSLMGGTTIYLMALYFGANNTQIGYLSAMIHVSGLVLLFLPRLLAGKNVITVQSSAWFLRGLACLLYVFVLFFQGQTAVFIIMAVYTLYCIARTVGVAMGAPVQRMLTTSATTGDLVVRSSTRNQTSRLFALFVSFLVLSIQQVSELVGLFILEFLGILMNTLAAWQIKQVPCREVIEYQPGRNVFVILRESLKNRERSLTMVIRWLFLSETIVFSFVVPLLRKNMGFPSNIIFIYTIITAVATIAAAYFLKPFVDRIGSKPLLMMASFLLAILAIIWAVLPSSIPHSFIFTLGFVTAFFMHMSMLLVSRLVLHSLPGKDKIGFTSMINFFSAILSLGVGLSAGMVADFSEQAALPVLNSFGLTFLLATVLALLTGVLCAFLKDSGSLSVKETINILFSTRNLKAFLDIYQFNETEDPMKRKSILLSIEQSDTAVATEEIQRMIRHPLSSEKGEVIKSLFENPRPALVDDLIQEALDQNSYHRQSAAFALGAYPDKQVEKVLIRLLDDPSPRIRSTAAKSLARVGNTSNLKKVQTLADDPTIDMWAAMNYFIAISIMDQEGRYLKYLFGKIVDSQGASFEQTMFSLSAKMLNHEPALADLYQEENLADNAGLELLLEDAKQLEPFLHHARMLREHFSHEKYEEIWDWCQELLEERQMQGPYDYLRQSIITFDAQSVDKEKTLAAVYFTYQILK
jgi:predicted MFS family arabinose efflux permease